MARRITEKFLEAQVMRLNKSVLGVEYPKYPEERFEIDYAYGMVSLHYVNESGSCADVLNIGHVPKRELSEKIYAFEIGLSWRKNNGK